MKKSLLTLGLMSLTLGLAAFADMPVPKSGYEFIKEETRAMQNDEMANPGMLTVEEGQQLFNKNAASGKSCASCHGEKGEKLDSKPLASYPLYDKTQGVIQLQDKIKQCREKQLGETSLATDSHELIALETFVRHLAVGQTMTMKTDGDIAPVLEKGKTLFNTRMGLIDMSCAHCHDMYVGQMIRGQKISQGQGNGFPAYRLDIGEMTTLNQRINQCLNSMRAAPFEVDGEDIKALGAYIMSRSNGLKIETPAVRY